MFCVSYPIIVERPNGSTGYLVCRNEIYTNKKHKKNHFFCEEKLISSATSRDA